jgi:alpha-tubulin suppressor-like RCC1 family protein
MRDGAAVWVAGVCACACAGCGRLGFDDLAAGDAAGDDGAGDGAPTDGFTRIIAGEETTCGIVRERAYCWGRGTDGELGDGASADRAVPTAVALPPGRVTDLSQGEGHGCAIVESVAHCWGRTAVGVPGMDMSPTPLAVTLPAPVTSIAVGGGFACAVAANQVYCWGDDAQGSLGNGAEGPSEAPIMTIIPAGTAAVAVDAGNDHAMVVLSDGRVFGWGHNDSGALGHGSFMPTQSATPVEILHQDSLPAIAGWHACALRTDGAVACWGLGDAGELGDGQSTNSPSPVLVSGFGELGTAVATGGGPNFFDASCAVREGTASCWGNGQFGRLGQGTTDPSPVPVEVAGLPVDIVEVAVGYAHACARSGDGTVRCWGRGDLGQLGDGAMATSFAPVVVATPPP